MILWSKNLINLKNKLKFFFFFFCAKLHMLLGDFAPTLKTRLISVINCIGALLDILPYNT